MGSGEFPKMDNDSIKVCAFIIAIILVAVWAEFAPSRPCSSSGVGMGDGTCKVTTAYHYDDSRE